MADNVKTYDFIVIGGGSGGMSAAKAAAAEGASVACFDFVTPSTQGTTWGLGGTCVNVGCVPKKLMHYSGLIGEAHEDARAFGWCIDESTEHDYSSLVAAVGTYVRKLNFSYRRGLKSANVEYINAKAALTEASATTGEVKYVIKGKGAKPDQELTCIGKKILLAVGGRPMIPEDVPGAKDFAITSDDIFWQKKHPGKTLVVGGAYIALECAGFLHGIGVDVEIAVRSILLRGFDRQCSEKVGNVMTERGTKFHMGKIPTKIEKAEGGENQLTVTFNDGSTGSYDTVMYATGRYPDTEACGGSNLTMKDGKFEVNEAFLIKGTENIYACGDIVADGLELTPVAIAQGEFIAKVLFAKDQSSTLQVQKLLENVPTSVFTPAEYGAVGLSEEAAIAQYGEDAIEVYHSEFESLELGAAHRKKAEACRIDEFDDECSPSCLAKLVCLRKTENQTEEKVLGIHFVGPQAGEVIQGFAIAMKTDALNKTHFDHTVGIHPTAAEVFCTLSITKRSGENHVAAGGCGGGKCG